MGKQIQPYLEEFYEKSAKLMENLIGGVAGVMDEALGGIADAMGGVVNDQEEEDEKDEN